MRKQDENTRTNNTETKILARAHSTMAGLGFKSGELLTKAHPESKQLKLL